MSFHPVTDDEDRRCFTYCGDDLCFCEAATNRIVEQTSAKFREELERIMASGERAMRAA